MQRSSQPTGKAARKPSAHTRETVRSASVGNAKQTLRRADSLIARVRAAGLRP